MSLKQLKAGEPITESWIASLVKAVLKSMNISAASPLKVQKDEAGIRISMPSPFQRRWAKLQGNLSKTQSADAIFQTWSDSQSKWVDEGTLTVKVVVGPNDATTAAKDQTVLIYADDVLGKWVLDTNEGAVCKFRATADWNGSTTGEKVIQAKKLIWNGTALVEGEAIMIRDYQGLAGKSLMNGAYFTEDGEPWHLTSPCPPASPNLNTSSFL